MPSSAPTDFDFGKNWASYTDKVMDESRVQAAVDSLNLLMAGESVSGRSFLDVGCGTGMFSVAAARLGARPVLGIDVNPLCVEVSRGNQRRHGTGTDVEFRTLSILDDRGVAAVGQYDVVYAWGSLHHSGRMWDAITRTASCVAPEGIFLLAIYNRHWTSGAWTLIKKIYNVSPRWLKSVWNAAFYPVIYAAKWAVTRDNPLKMRRGMDFYHDVVDWIGGYPYEYASIDEVRAFVEKLGFTLVRVFPTELPTGNNQFVFRKCR